MEVEFKLGPGGGQMAHTVRSEHWTLPTFRDQDGEEQGKNTVKE